MEKFFLTSHDVICAEAVALFYIYIYIFFFFLCLGFCSEDYFSRIECKLYFFSYNLYRYYACDLLNGEAGCFEQCKIIERIGFMSDPLLADSSSTIQSASYLIFIGSLSLLQVGCSWLRGRGGMLEFPKN